MELCSCHRLSDTKYIGHIKYLTTSTWKCCDNFFINIYYKIPTLDYVLVAAKEKKEYTGKNVINIKKKQQRRATRDSLGQDLSKRT